MSYALYLFDSVGLTINVKKSVLVPTQEVEFLGIILNSCLMTATLPLRKIIKIQELGRLLLKDRVSLRDLASFIGLAVAAEPAVDLAPVRYKYLEIIRNRELAGHHGDYAARVSLDEHAKELVLWWVNNVPLQSKSLRSSSPDLELFADACLTGWGAIVGSVASGGSWAHAELDHINCLELRAI